ncbi:MAG: diguanylate cyclase, partial [Candidatus Margulisbacteria bacterium]|nr:diguanylate cyclase [Candidatus Margulisiibacteriota bacterium]
MISQFIVLIFFLVYLSVLFIIAVQTERGSSILKKLSNSPIIYTLSIAVFCTTWTYYGSVGKAATSGLFFLPIYLGPTISIFIWWFLIKKMIRIKNMYKITNLADFVTARYSRSTSVGAVVTIICLVGMLPYIALQLKAIISSFQLISAPPHYTVHTFMGDSVGWFLVLAMGIFTIIFGARKLDPTEHHRGMIMVVAIESLVKLLAFLLIGFFVTFLLFHGFRDIFSKISLSSYSQILSIGITHKSNYWTWLTYLILSGSAVIFLPRQFYTAVVENIDENHLQTSIWLFPLYMLLINIFVIPIALGGLLLGLPIQKADMFILHIPLLTHHNWLVLLVFLGGLSAGSSMIMLCTMTITTMITNHLLLPYIASIKPLNFLNHHVLKLRWIVILIFLMISYLFAIQIGDSYMLVNIGMISFAAVLQFAPAIVIGLFWRKANKFGALAGMISGFIIWLYTLFLPAIIKSGWQDADILINGPWHIKWLIPENMFGITISDHLTHTVFWSMLFNVVFLILGSLIPKISEEEQKWSDTIVNILNNTNPQDYRTSFRRNESIKVPDKIKTIHHLLNEYYSEKESDGIINKCLATANIGNRSMISIVELAHFQGEIEKVLSGSIGTSTAHNVMAGCNLFTPEEKRMLAEVYSEILTNLNLSPEELIRKIDYYKDKEKLLASQARELETKVEERTKELREANTQLNIQLIRMETAETDLKKAYEYLKDTQ